MLKYPYLCLTLSSTPKCYFFFFAGRHFFIRKMKIKMADRKKHVLSKVVKNIIFHNKTLLVMFYRHNKTFWYQFCNSKHFLKAENSEDSLASSCVEPGGGVHQNRTWMCLPDLENLYTNFLPNFPPISIPFSKEKHPIWIKLGAFYNNLPKIHPIYVIWAPSSLMKTPRSLYQILRKSAPKGRHIYVYYVNVRTPPRGV